MGTRIDDYSEDQAVSEMLHNTKFCLSCGKRLERGHQINKDRGYCSRYCYLKKPPKMAYLEQEYQRPAREVLIEILNTSQGNTMAATAELAGTSKQTLYRWMESLKIKKVVEWR